jgi:hypothetical protein
MGTQAPDTNKRLIGRSDSNRAAYRVPTTDKQIDAPVFESY